MPRWALFREAAKRSLKLWRSCRDPYLRLENQLTEQFLIAHLKTLTFTKQRQKESYCQNKSCRPVCSLQHVLQKVQQTCTTKQVLWCRGSPRSRESTLKMQPYKRWHGLDQSIFMWPSQSKFKSVYLYKASSQQMSSQGTLQEKSF